MSHLSTTFSTPLFPIIAHFSCPSTDNLKTREQRPPKLAFKSSNPNTAERPRLGLEYVSMHSRDSDSGQLNRYSLGIAEADPFVVVLAFFFFRVVGNVFTSNDDDAPFSNANDVHERTTPVLLRVSSGMSGGVLSRSRWWWSSSWCCFLQEKKWGGNLEKIMSHKKIHPTRAMMEDDDDDDDFYVRYYVVRHLFRSRGRGFFFKKRLFSRRRRLSLSLVSALLVASLWW